MLEVPHTTQQSVDNMNHKRHMDRLMPVESLVAVLALGGVLGLEDIWAKLASTAILALSVFALNHSHRNQNTPHH